MTALPMTLMSDEEVAHFGRDVDAGFGALRTARGLLPLVAMDVDARVSGVIASMELALRAGSLETVQEAPFELDPVPYTEATEPGVYVAQTFVTRHNFVANSVQQSRWVGNLGTVGLVGLPNPVASYRQLSDRVGGSVGERMLRFSQMNFLFLNGRSYDIFRDKVVTGESRMIVGAGMFSRKHVLSVPEEELRNKLIDSNATAAAIQEFDDSFPDEQYVAVGVLVTSTTRETPSNIDLLILPVGELNAIDYWLAPDVPEQHDPLQPGDDLNSYRYTHPPILAHSVTLSVDACEHMRMEFSPDGLKAVIRIAELIYHPNEYFINTAGEWANGTVQTKDIGVGTDLLFYEFVISPDDMTATSSVVHRSHVEVAASGTITSGDLTYTQSVDTTYIVWANYDSDGQLLYTADKVELSSVKGPDGITFSEKSTLLFQNGTGIVHREASWVYPTGDFVSPTGFNIQFEYLDPIRPERRIYSKTSVRALTAEDMPLPGWMPIRNVFNEREFEPYDPDEAHPFFRNEVFIGDTAYVDQPFAMTSGGGLTWQGMVVPRMFSSLNTTADSANQPYATGDLLYETNSLHGCLMDNLMLDEQIYRTSQGLEPDASKSYKANDTCRVAHTARLDSGHYKLTPISLCNRYRAKTQSIAPMVGDGKAIADWCVYDGEYIAAYSLYGIITAQLMNSVAADGVQTWEEMLSFFAPASHARRGGIWGQVAFGLPRRDMAEPEVTIASSYPHVMVSSLDLKAITGVGDLDGNIFPFGVI